MRAYHRGEVAFLLALCALLYYFTTRFDAAPAALSQNIPPEFFPQLVLGVVVLLACVLLLQPPPQPAAAGAESEAPQLGVKTFAVAGVLAGVCLLFQYAGAPVAMAACCVAMPLFWGERRPLWIAAYALLYPAALYGLFGMVLGVRFPEGIWS